MIKITISSLLLIILFCTVCPANQKEIEKAEQVKVTVLSTMLSDFRGIGEWGFAALVEADGKKVLFDTGARPDTVAMSAIARKNSLANFNVKDNIYSPFLGVMFRIGLLPDGSYFHLRLKLHGSGGSPTLNLHLSKERQPPSFKRKKSNSVIRRTFCGSVFAFFKSRSFPSGQKLFRNLDLKIDKFAGQEGLFYTRSLTKWIL